MAIRNLIPWRERAVDLPRLREDPFGALHREMNRMFEEIGRSFDLTPWRGGGLEAFQPRIDVRETDDEILVTAEIPGLEEKDFQLDVTEDALTLKGEKREESEERGPVYRVERSYGAFQRTIPLPCAVETENCAAVYRNGVLTVTLPKAPSARRHVHHIEVKSR